MPKKVFDDFYAGAVRDIKSHYQEGDKYFSVRVLADKFRVSLQTAQKGVKKLEESGFISTKMRSGITIISTNPAKKLENRTIAVVSANSDTRFNEGYMKGISGFVEDKGIKAVFYDVTEKDLESVAFGDYLLSLKADGIIALYMRNSALPFYHAIREGQDIVSDIIYDGLPMMPSIQPDNHRHAYDAGKLLLERGYRRFLMAGYRPKKGNRRFEGFFEAVKESCDDIQYLCLSEYKSIYDIDLFFRGFDKNCAVFSDDYSANFILAAKFVQHRIKAKNENFMVYDSDEVFFEYKGLKSIRSIGPSLQTIGRELCVTLIAKWETGEYPWPLQRKI